MLAYDYTVDSRTHQTIMKTLRTCDGKYAGKEILIDESEAYDETYYGHSYSGMKR